MSVITSVYSTQPFMTKFCELYSIDKKLNDNKIFDAFIAKIVDSKNEPYITLKKSLSKITSSITMKKECKHEYNMFLKNINIGDIVNVIYTPDSQKDIAYYITQTIVGNVIYIDTENDDMLLLENNNDGIYTIYSMEREHCSYYGDTRGYMYSITRLS